jgi:hypothetical protein
LEGNNAAERTTGTGAGVEHEARGKINMKFFNFNKSLFHKSVEDFDSISGYSDVKNIIRRTLDSEESFNLLLWGEPASSKTLDRKSVV